MKYKNFQKKLRLSEARLAANRANAQKSTGPKTDGGKAASSQNAITHGLTSQRIAFPAMLEGECQDDFDSLLADYTHRFRPSPGLEQRMVRGMVETEWQIRRVRIIEESLLEMELADPLASAAGPYKIAKAFDLLAQRGSLQLANRILTRLNRELGCAIKQFLELRKQLPLPPAEPLPEVHNEPIETLFTSSMPFNPNTVAAAIEFHPSPH
jgi:hypothetical protein